MMMAVPHHTIVGESNNIYNSDTMKKMGGLKYMSGYYHDMK
jgi:hypothetical protein